MSGHAHRATQQLPQRVLCHARIRPRHVPHRPRAFTCAARHAGSCHNLPQAASASASEPQPQSDFAGPADGQDQASDPLHRQRDGPSRRQIFLAGAAIAGAGVAGATVSPQPARAARDDGSSWTDRVSEFTLGNGLHFIVLERHNAPVVSCSTYASVGAFDEETGKTGLAHLLEHMAFKGTTRIGSTDPRREAGLLDALDELFYEQQEARGAGQLQRAAAAGARLEELQARAEALAVPNAFGRLLQRAGGVGLNAGTSHDSTRYYVSLPANKLELWFAVEAERFQAPVFRQLYSEKRVVAEERRLRVDGSPMGAFQEDFAAVAFANNYSRPVIGWPDDVARLGRREVAQFFRSHYGPRALTITIVGDVHPSQVRTFAEKYFGEWREPQRAAAVTLAANGGDSPAAPGPEFSREFERASLMGPAALHAFYRPGMNSPDAIPLEVVSALLSGTRTSRLYQALVQPGRAVSASCVAAYPGEKHPGAMLLYGNAGPGGSLERLSGDLLQEAHCLAASPAAPSELQAVKKGFRVTLLEALASNSSMAATLGSYSALTGDWRRIVRDLDTVDALSPEAVRAAAERVFSPDNMFSGRVLPLKMPQMKLQMELPRMVQ